MIENKGNKSLKGVKVGIMGVGMVGGAMKNYFEKTGAEIFLYDVGLNLGSKQEVNSADIIFICVPTPFNAENGFDLSYVECACADIAGEKIIVIKSTILPGTTDKLQKKYPQHKFLFNPEFLSESTANDDMQNPDRQLVGYADENKGAAEKVLDILPEAPYKKVMPAAEAEMIKYFNNTFNAIKVAFANQMYDLCQALNINYDSVMESAAKSKFIITKDHLTVWHKEFRGYGGKCLPKDTKALIQLADSLGVDLKLHKSAEEVNNNLMKEQNIKDPEKFSKR
jgi:UDPglucose 6-dehydrogenase